MPIYKRGKTWWVHINTPDGRRIRRSTKTQSKQEAQEFYDRVKADQWRILKLGDRKRYKWQTAVERWLNETSHKASRVDDIAHLRWLHKYLYGKYLDEITRDFLDHIQSVRKSEGVANATVNRLFEVLRAILRRAENEWDWLDKAPVVRMLPEPKRRVRWLTHDEAFSLIKELPEHLAEMVRFSLATGLRESNVTHLEWSQIDLERKRAWIHADQAKARKAIPVPLNTEAISVIKRQLGKHSVRVFTFNKQPVGKANTKAWRNALVRAGIEDFRWHDLRHTWATWHVQKGTPLHVLQELGGWSDIRMVQRYAHLSADHLAQFTEELAPSEIYDTKMTQSNVINFEARKTVGVNC